MGRRGTLAAAGLLAASAAGVARLPRAAGAAAPAPPFIIAHRGTFGIYVTTRALSRPEAGVWRPRRVRCAEMLLTPVDSPGRHLRGGRGPARAGARSRTRARRRVRGLS